VSLVIDEHRLYLRDRHRVSAYERALHDIVHPGAVVVDLASGTGILGLLACRAGASRVYAIERDGIAGLARQIARANDLDGIITNVRGTSRSVTLPEHADVVVCDQMGPLGIEAGILDLARDARERFLRPGGTLVPSRLELVLAAIEHPRVHDRLTFWSGKPANFDFGAAAEIASNSTAYVRLRPEHLLSAPVSAGTIDLTRDVCMPIRLSATFHASRTGTLHGIAGWFVATLSPNVTMTNSPVAGDRIRRRQVCFPIRESVAVQAGEHVNVTLEILPTEGVYSWEVQIAPSVRLRQTTLHGLLLSRDDLVRTNPAHRPVRSALAEAELTTLRLCDGEHTLREIERGVFDAHRGLFASESDASAFVARVLARD
jgi:type I protein arginine methyltransferase